MRKILLLALSIFSFLAAFAQVDTEFWFAAPHICEHSRVTGGYHMVLFSYDKPAHIELSMPANSAFVTKTYDLNAYDYVDIEMAQDYDDAVANLEVPFDVVSQRGIHITSTSKIGGYYNHTGNNAEAYSLKNEALGTNFGVVSQTVFQIQSESETYEDAYSSAQIVATEDNTIVTITPVTGHPVSPNCNATPIVVHLNRGETYAVRSCSKDPLYGVNGMRISSNKPIAVCSTDDSTQAGTGAAGLDLTGEQLVSLDFAGKRYAAIGQQNSWNSCSITALENGTTVTLSTGQVLNMQKDETQNISMATVQALYIESNKDVLVYQITGEDDEAAGTMLPALDCTGSRYVAYKRMPDSYMTYLNIVTKSSNINSIYINNSKVASSLFHPVPGTGNAWYYASIQKSGADDFLTVECKSGFIQLGVLDMKGTSLTNLKSCTYGYFSDYGSAHEYDEYALFDAGGIYTWPNHYKPDGITPQIFNAEGIYKDTLTDKNGCDSICVLHLSANPYPDNVADVECVVPPMSSNFEMKELFKTDGVHSMTTPMVADLDGDGQSEIICCKWPDEAKIFLSDGFLVINGQTGDVIDTILTCQYPICGQPITIADVNGDGRCEIFLSDIDNYVYCYDYQGNLLWNTTFALDGTYIPLLGNLTDDNIPELLFGKYIFNPITGTLIHEILFSSDGTGWGAPHGVGVAHRNFDPRAYHLGALSDVDHDGNLEYCAGNTIYKLNITNPNGQVGNSSSIYKQAESIASVHNYDGQTVVVDFDNDGIQDICVLGLPKDLAMTSPQPEYDIYVWNSQTAQIVAHDEFLGVGKETADGTWTGQSIPYCGDLNGDGDVDLTFSAKGLAMYTYTYDGSQPNGLRKIHEYAPFSETCGYTVFDFNMDGKSEIVYRGTHTLNIVDGSTLTPLSTPIEAFSGTVTEYPVVADVNKDGQAEIIICRGHIEWKSGIDKKEGIRGWVSVYGAMNSGAWSSARSVWNQWAYNSININDDMSVPRYMYDVSIVYPNGTRPFNSFLAQKPIIDKQGDIFVPAADAAVSTCSQSVVNDSVVITLKYCNNGDANLVAPYEITTYQNEYRGTVVQVDTIKEGLAINECKTITIKVPSLSVCKAALDTAFIIAVNDDGHGIAQHGNQQAECDTTNNTYKILLPNDLRRDTAYLNVTISQGESYIFDGHTYTTGTQDTATFVSAAGCDSVCVLDLKVIPYPDNVDDATGCMVPPSTNVWSIRQKAISGVSNIDDCGTTICGDIDGDGQVEILAPIITDDVKFSKIGIFNSQAKAKRIIDVPTCSAFINIAIAKVKVSDSDYRTLIFFLAYDRYLYAYDPNGSQFWKSDQQFTSHSGEAVAIASLSLADFNHDGWTEIYIGPEIFDAASGKRLAKYNGNKGHSDRAWKASRQSYQSVVADVVGDDRLELILGNTACSVNINSRTNETLNSITAFNSVPAANMKMEDNSNIPSTDGHTLLADMDGDGKLDVVVMHIDKSNRIIYIYVWNPRTGSMICTKKITNAAEFGTPNVGDIDHDGNLELNFIIGTYSGETTDANDKIYSLKYNKSTHNLEVFWTLHHDDSSGSTGLSLFDFNQDGTMEIVYRDCEHLRIINGSMIHHITGNPVAAPYDLANIPCTSGTGVEYPVIADVDADGEAEIIVVGNGSKLVIYESDLAPWAPARSVWNQFAYNITNVNEDLTIPTYLYNNAQIFTDASSTTRQPFNNFLSQVTTINTQGVPFIAAADVNVSTSTTTTYENDSIKIDLSFCNQGDLQVNAPYCITAYKNAYRGSVLFVDTIKAILPIGDCLSHQVGFPITNVCSDKDINSIVIAVNDDGHGIAQHGNQQAECDTTNNRTSIVLPPNLRRDTTYVNIIIEQGQKYTFNGHDYTTDTQDTATFTAASGCDSVCILDLKVVPYPDNVEVVNCSAPLENNDWTIKTAYSSEEIMSPLVIPLVGDINDDGINEILCFAPNSTHKYFGATQINIINGVTHNIIDQININGVVPTESAGIYGIVKLPNRHTILVVVITGKKILGYDLCASHTSPIWTKSIPYNMVNINFADFNNDGYPEVYCGNYIFDVETGNLLAHGGTNSGKSFAHKNETGLSLSTDDYMHAPFAADMDEDGKLELVAGNEIYKVSITNRSGEAGNSISLLKSIAPPTGVPADGHTQVADFNLDGHLDVLISNKPQTTNTNVYYYVWDVFNNTTSQPIIIPNVDGVERGKSFPLIADINADGELEIIVQSDTYHTYDKVQAYKYNIAGNNFTHLWNLTVDEDSYSNTMSVFDFNHDGINELILTDQTTIKILNGSGKSHITGNDTVNIYAMSSFSFGECTIMQYPVVVDVDKDGTADIVAIGRYGSGHTYKGSLNIFTSAGKPWAPARSVWNQYMYNVFNINEDLTIPTYQYSNAKSFTDPDDPTIIRRPYNNFFQQSTTIDQYGRYVNRAADVAVTSVTQAYTETEWSLTPSYCNNGERELLAPYKITIYANSYHGDVIATETINQALPVGDCVQPTLQIPSSVLCADSTIHKLVIAVNDGGLGVAQHGNQQAECDTTNNTIVVILPKLQSDTTRFYPVICSSELPYTHALSGIVFPVGYISGKDSCITKTNKYGCDSVTQVTLTINPILYGDTAATFCNGHPFKWHGVDYPTGGDYQYTYTSKITGCDSIVTLHLSQLDPTDSVEVVTICAGASHIWHGNPYTTTTTTTEILTNAAGCDSVCTLQLTVLPELKGDTSATFCKGQPFKWHGVDYPTAGDYPYTYTSKVTGCDSIVTLHLTQLEPTDSVENVTLCAGGSHTWHGQTFTTSTTITETIPNAAGCDSVCTLNLTILPPLTGDTSATFCSGKSFTWHGTQYSIAGNYPYTYTSKVAPYCDSIVTLHLTQLEPTDSVENVTLCYGESHVWHGQTFTTSTIITETIPNAAGCDSVCTLNLTILPALTGDTSATFCKGTPFIWHGTSYPTEGDYPYTYTSKVAPYCDSIVTLHLTQLEPTDSIEVVTICYGGSHTWHGHTYTATTTTTETIDNAVGCDSVCTLKLTVLQAITGDTNMTVCDTLLPVTWRGQSITGAGEYYHTATASSGCDSTITLHVTVETCLPPALTCDTLEATLIVPDICADDDSMYIDITYTKGLPISYNVSFGADAVAQGFQSSYTGNVRVTSSTIASISIPIPNDPTNRQVYPKPNVYSIDISIMDTCDAYTTWRSQNFLIHYPSWLTLQRWNDVISLYNERYNGGYAFSQIRWFHEGTLLESRGDHDGYIYQRPTLVYGDAYWAELTRADDGVTITTCPIYPVPMTDSTKMDDVTDPYIIVTPTVVTPSNPTVTVKTNICGEYYVYYVDGHLLDKQNFCPKDNHTFTIDIDPCYVRTGLYILVFYGEEGTIKAVKLLVEP